MNVVLLELPVYRSPRWKNVGITMIEKKPAFCSRCRPCNYGNKFTALVLSSYGPSAQMEKVQNKYETLRQQAQSPAQITDIKKQYNSEKLQNSYAGILGRSIEPVIKPLGFDWKIGIALITSFAAEKFCRNNGHTIQREENDNSTLQQKCNQPFAKMEQRFIHCPLHYH